MVAEDLMPVLWHMILQRLRGIFDGTARGKMVLLSMLLECLDGRSSPEDTCY